MLLFAGGQWLSLRKTAAEKFGGLSGDLNGWFLVKAEIWLLDEPGANLDADGQAMVAREARAAAERGVLVAIATNAPGEEALADECIPLEGH